MIIRDLEPVFKKVINRRLVFIHDNKVIRSGMLTSYSAKSFNLKFELQNNGIIKALELPYPFNLYKENNTLVFDYRISNIKDMIKQSELDEFIEDNEKVVSPFYNSTISVKLGKS